MEPMITKSRSVVSLAAIFAILSMAHSAAALVTVSQTTTETGTLVVGDTFEVDVLLSWDGSGSLTGLFSSHEWDSAQLTLLSATFQAGPTTFETRPVPLKGSSYDPALTRFGSIAAGLAGDDLSSTARTVQYGTVNPLNGVNSQRVDELITTLEFEVVGVGDGVAEVSAVFLNADEIQGDTSTFGAPVAVTVPEPGSALLALAALVSVGGVVARRRS